MIASIKELNLIDKLYCSIPISSLPLIEIGITAIISLIKYLLYNLFVLLKIHTYYSAVVYNFWYININFVNRIRMTKMSEEAGQNLKKGIIFIGLNILTSGITTYSFINLFLFLSKEKDTGEKNNFINCVLSIISAKALLLIYEYLLLQLKWKILSFNKKKLTKSYLQSEIAALVPHFIFNVLGTLFVLTPNEGKDAKKD